MFLKMSEGSAVSHALSLRTRDSYSLQGPQELLQGRRRRIQTRGKKGRNGEMEGGEGVEGKRKERRKREEEKQRQKERRR